MSTSKILLILGAGPRVGKTVADHFSSKGYQVAVAGRTLTSFDATSTLRVKADFADPSSITGVFEEVREKLGVPNVVVYNASVLTFSPNALAPAVEGFTKSLNVNVTSLYAAAVEAVSGFETLPDNVPKTLIYTGNGLPWHPDASLNDLGLGKAAGAYLIEVLSVSLRDKGFQFYYGDERKPDGSHGGQGISGENHARFYYQLAERKEQGPWKATFVGDKYVEFKE